ncbi:hypothetical protein CGRA01v4_02398 [Colletotrichum graminicola]|nr:hypothetical protein CGRA01v4_02398 [Colletotrichum graminicola]
MLRVPFFTEALDVLFLPLSGGTRTAFHEMPVLAATLHVEERTALPRCREKPRHQTSGCSVPLTSCRDCKSLD